jgi:hypothetical protein
VRPVAREVPFVAELALPPVDDGGVRCEMGGKVERDRFDPLVGGPYL